MTSYRRWIDVQTTSCVYRDSGTLSLRYTVIKKVAFAKKLFFIIKQPLICNQFFSFKQKCLVFKISRFFCFWEIPRFQNLSRHHGHCYIMEVTLVLCLLNPKYENENLVKYQRVKLLYWKGLGTQPKSSKLFYRLLNILSFLKKKKYIYILIGHVWWLNKFLVKRYIQKCTFSHELILILTSQIW